MTHPEPASSPAAVAAYAAQLRRAHPSRALDERIEDAIRDASTAQASRARARSWHLSRGPAIAAAITALVVAGLVMWLAVDRHEAAVSARAASDRPPTDVELAQADAAPSALAEAIYAQPFSVAPAGTYSLWPTESAVFRLQTRLDASMPALGMPAGVRGEQRFWVDVRIANDGSMRIVRIVPVDEGT